VDDIYITGNATSTTNGQIYKVLPGGGVQSVAGGLSRPFGLAVDFAGTFYTSDVTAGTITKISGGIATPFASGLTSPARHGLRLRRESFHRHRQYDHQDHAGRHGEHLRHWVFYLYDVAFNDAGSMFVDDQSIKRIYKYTLGVKSVVTTLTSSGAPYVSRSPAGTIFSSPKTSAV
jgi:hypothetical protein